MNFVAIIKTGWTCFMMSRMMNMNQTYWKAEIQAPSGCPLLAPPKSTIYRITTTMMTNDDGYDTDGDNDKY